MKDKTNPNEEKRTKKAQILEFFDEGVHDVTELAFLTQSRPSYAASVLQQAGRLTGYFDLYTSSSRPVNAYSRFFSGKMGFRNPELARHSVEILERYYRQFSRVKDRAGQHHALALALTLCDRARWCGKEKEATIFRDWLVARLGEADLPEKESSGTDTSPSEVKKAS